ncbi:MAG: winged helix-turn-helix domain-containing protein [Azospirillaceae bacterium]|nr:winged helix-turn-helix domain-containing protein [Azospirillaceae bacterium]
MGIKSAGAMANAQDTPAAPITAKTVRIGAWTVDPAACQLSRQGETVRVEERILRVLLALAARPGETVTSDDLLEQAWSGTIVTQDSVYQAIAALRRLLGDDPRNPSYIATVPRRGYRLVAMVAQVHATSVSVPPDHQSGPPLSRPREGRRHALWGAIGLALLVGLGLAFLIPRTGPSAVAAPASLAVLPFLDLTSQAMAEEYFADGMTEELIDKLSKVAGFQVPPPTASFSFKGSKMPLGAIAQTLNVAYLLDGSVRRAGPKLRVAARLVRARDGFVVWSGTYDRSSDDVLKIQDDVAEEIAKALAGCCRS